MLVRLTSEVRCFDRWGHSFLESRSHRGGGAVLKKGTVLNLLPPKKRKMSVLYTYEKSNPLIQAWQKGGARIRRRSVVEFRLASGSRKMFALKSDIEGSYKPVPLHKQQ